MVDITNPSMTSDPRYMTALGDFQAGRWQEAIRGLEDLARQRPDDATIAHLLEEARFKARLDAGARVTARRWILPWRRWLGRALILAAIAFLVIAGIELVNRRLAPALALAQRDQQIATLLKQGNAYLEAENFDAAQGTYQSLLTIAPKYAPAEEGLARVTTGREIAALYNQAVAMQEAGDFGAALAAFTDLSVRASGYRDVSVRIADIKRQQDLDGLFTAAEGDLAAGRFSDAVSKYQQLQLLNATYKRDFISGRLFDLDMQLGREIIDRTPPALDQIPRALDLFSQAASLKPRDSQAALEQNLAASYLQGQKAYNEKRWDDAITSLRAAYDQRPDYLGGALVSPLYDSCIHSGDAFRDGKDYYRAWDRYQLAASLPGIDVTLARGRMETVRPYLTPTPTPSPTATPTVVDVQAAIAAAMPTPVPSTTPVPGLSTFRNQIVFYAARDDDKAGLWVMNPDGSNRRYLGVGGTVQKQYDDLRAKETWSPDGRYRSYTTQGNGDSSAQIYIQGVDKDQFGNLPTWKVTNLGKLAYDPVWSPDGAHIAFTGELGPNTGDDIFTIQPDGKDQWKRTISVWEWNKHASWSPDSRRIAFWSNREGTKQIYVMDWEGRQQVNISKVAWDEYDPIWIK